MNGIFSEAGEYSLGTLGRKDNLRYFIRIHLGTGRFGMGPFGGPFQD